MKFKTNTGISDNFQKPVSEAVSFAWHMLDEKCNALQRVIEKPLLAISLHAKCGNEERSLND